MQKFIAYLRVSTDQQGASGLGLEAQRELIARHVASQGGHVLAEHCDIESGGHDGRPGLWAAIRDARRHRAVLVVASLDRLSRSVELIARLHSRLRFVAADAPTAQPFEVHIRAALAQEERRLISLRTRRALAAAKARGVKLGNPNLAAHAPKAAAAVQRGADAFALSVLPHIRAARAAGAKSLREVAAALENAGVHNRRAESVGGQWAAMQVARVEARALRVAARQ